MPPKSSPAGRGKILFGQDFASGPCSNQRRRPTHFPGDTSALARIRDKSFERCLVLPGNRGKVPGDREMEARRRS